MKILNIKKYAALLAVACSLIFASSASALTILTIGDANPFYLGSVDPDVPANPAAEEGYIDFLAGMAAPSGPIVDGAQTYNRSINVFAGLPDADFSSKDESAGANSFTLDGSTAYVLGKYGQVGHVWFVLGLVDDVTIPSTATAGGLSHTSLFGGDPTRVPDAGATVLLIALGLAGLGLVARRRKA